MRPLSLTRLGGTFAARVEGLDPRGMLSDAQIDSIDQALAEEGVLVFRWTPMTDDQQQAFIERFGPPSEVKLAELQSARSAHPHFFDVTTVEDDGSPLDPAGPRAMYLKANLLWHTDGSQTQPPIRLTGLSARQLPSDPPDTQYADMRAAYEALDLATRLRIDAMKVEHSIFHSRALMGMKESDFTADARRRRPPVVHPLVRIHPRTGLKSLYLASHASHVIGLPIAEGRALIERLTAHATEPRFVYSHRWEPGDFVMWDDSWTMHRATPYSGREPRVLRWSGVREAADV